MNTAALYARAALPLVPGASLLPFVAGRGDEMPDIERAREAVRPDAAHVEAYRRVCGFAAGDALPATYPHVLAFPLHLEVMTDGRFPFGAVGLVHVANRITAHRAIGADEPLNLRVHATAIEPHPRGRAFSLVTEARAGDELVWEERSTMLRRGGGSGACDADAGPPPPDGDEEWELAGDLGRRYASVSGDRNPIHLHPLSARVFGFPRAIAHGMWTKARCLAALEPPDAFTVEVAFRKPILLPARVRFGAEGERFAVRTGQDALHLTGTVTR